MSTIAKRKSREFEELAFIIVKNELGDYQIIKECLTQSVNDGGYDGEFTYLIDYQLIRVLLEAKLRSNVKADLPLNDFAKAIIIAVTRLANDIYIITNLHFSDGTIDKVTMFAQIADLNIHLYNGNAINHLIKSNTIEVSEFSKDLLNLISSSENKSDQKCILLTGKQSMHTVPSKIIPIDYDIKINTIIKALLGKKKIIVTGSPCMGKSFYIEQLVHHIMATKIDVKIIDVSSFSTYKEFLIDILEKVFGLSLELIHLLDDVDFKEAFRKIDDYHSNEKDIDILQFIFSKKDHINYDYSIIFAKVANLIEKLTLRNKIKIVAFINLSTSEKEVLQLLVYLLRHLDLPCILEVTENEYRYYDNEWKSVKEQLYELNNVMYPHIQIKDWNFIKQKDFLNKNIPQLNEEQCRNIINQFGGTPKDLTNLLELVQYSELNDNSPVELIYEDIMEYVALRSDTLELKCLEYLQMNYSHIVYLYIFLVVFNGKVSNNFIVNFRKDIDWFNNCYLAIKKTKLFKSGINYVKIESMNILNILNDYIKDKISCYDIVEVLDFIQAHIDEEPLSDESYLEIMVNIALLSESDERIPLHIDLGKTYLKCMQNKKAYEVFHTAYTIVQDENPILDHEIRIQLYLGLLKTSIWNTKEKKEDILYWLDELKKDFSKIKQYTVEYLQYQLEYYMLGYQFYHSLGDNEQALSMIKKGIELIEDTNFYKMNPSDCAISWRYYAVAVKETSKSIEKCLEIFRIGERKCFRSAKLMLGHIIHKNMIIDDDSYQIRLKKKLKNYKILDTVVEDLSIDEFLHFKKNIAALHFNLREYDKAWNMFSDLLPQSINFGITREQIRILNDMANIEWLRNNMKETSNKYKKAIRIANEAGYDHNYWPVLINFCSFLIYSKDYEEAYRKHKEILNFLKDICIISKKEELAFEIKDYYRASILISLSNMIELYYQLMYEDIIEDARNICDLSGIRYKEKEIKQKNNYFKASLQDTMYHHRSCKEEYIYVLKD